MALGQQVVQLLSVGGVVQHHQPPLVAQPRLVKAGALLHPGGDRLVRNPEGVEEPAQHLARVAASPTGTTQVGIQSPVAQLAGELVGQVDSNGGLPHPGGSGEDRDPRATLSPGSQVAAKLAQLALAAEQRGGVGGQARRAGQ